MWWAEFDSVGEEAVRGYVERNSYTPTGMEAARQWFARRELLQLGEHVQSIRAPAERAQGSASESLSSASEPFTLASRVDANSRAIAEIAANAKKMRTMVLVAMVASLFALCAIVMVLASSRRVAPNTKQPSAQPTGPKQDIARVLRPAVHPAETQQPAAVLPENVKKKQSSNAPSINSPDLKPEGQSLAEVLALIGDRVGGEGTINFTAQFHDVATARDYNEQLSYEVSNVTIDPNRCQVGYH